MAIRADRVGVRQDQVDVHGRVTSPSFLNELLEDLPEWTDMPVWVNGTEEVLPSNTSVPVTSPILADIAYPDIRRDNQYFTYRESPTPVDGLAKIKSIKGNTLVWNQLVQNGNFADNSGWQTYNGRTLTVSNNIATILTNEYLQGVVFRGDFKNVIGHKYLISAVLTSDTALNYARFNMYYNGTDYQPPVTYQGGTPSEELISVIWTSTMPTTERSNIYFTISTQSANATLQIKNFQAFDLTAMGLDNISSIEEFKSLFNLPYYDYNTGSLLSFNGTGLKTIGFNQWDEVWEHGSLGNNGENTGSSASPEIRSTNYIPIIQNASYYLNVPDVAVVHYYGSADLSNYKGNQYIAGAQLLNIPNGTNYIRFRTIGSYGDYKNDICLNISDPNRNGTYEPYTENTTNLPVSTYFPTGMKSAGSVYDELTPTKAITRIGAVDLGSLDWSYNSTYGMYSTGISELVKKPSASNIKVNAISTVGTLTDWATFFASGTSSGLWAINTGGYLGIATTETDSTTFKNSLQGVYLFYELATPVELPTMSFE